MSKYISIPYPQPSSNVNRRRRDPSDAPITDKKHPFSIRVSDEEYDVIKRAARDAGLNISEYGRWILHFSSVQIINGNLHEDPSLMQKQDTSGYE